MRKLTERALRYTDFTPVTHPALVALIDFAMQRPGFDSRNYGDWQSYSADLATTARQLKKITELIRIADHVGLTDEQIIEASAHAYSGRLSWTGSQWEYCPGQYWPVEYRQAVIAVFRAAMPCENYPSGRHTILR